MEFDDGRKCDAIEKANQRWNNIYNNYERDKIKYDDWLDLFDRAIQNCQTPIIDLGCGSGNDTLYLIERGKKLFHAIIQKMQFKILRKIFQK